MADIKERFREKADEVSIEIKDLLKEHGTKKIGEVHLSQIYQGMRGMTGLVSETSLLDAQEGIRFRGYTIPELQEKLPKAPGGSEPLPEGLFYLMLVGELPDEDDVHTLTGLLQRRSHVPTHVFQTIEALPIGTHPMTQFVVAVMALQTESQFAKKYAAGLNKKDYWEAVFDDAMDLIARLPRVAAYIYRRKYKFGDHIQPNGLLDWAGNFAHMMGYENESFKELMRLYDVYSRGAPSPLPELEIQYSDYAEWQRQWLQGEVLDEKLTDWERQFGDDPPLLELPVDDGCRTGTPARAALQKLVLSRELTHELKALGQRESATMFMTMLAAFEWLLHKYTGQVDMVVGTGIANRNRSEIEELIGFFVNMLVVRTDLSGNPTFKQLLARVREATLAAYMFEDLPFEKLVETLRPDRNVAGTSLLKLVFWHQSVPMNPFSLEGLTFTPLELNNEMIYFDFMVEIAEREEGFTIRLNYNTSLFNSETIARLLTDYKALLQSVVEQPERRLLDIPVLLADPTPA